MKYFILVLVFFISCSTKNEESLVIYFEDGYTDDGPFGFPNFSEIANTEPDLIHQFDDIEIARSLFTQIERAIRNASPKTSEFSIDSYKVKSVYLMFSDSTKNCFFNSSCDFYNARGEYLFHDVNLATTIKRLIHYDKTLDEGIDPDIQPGLYYKVVLRVKNKI